MILLDLKDSRPIYEQVAEKLQELMMLGVLEEDSQMPSVRSLAMELSINPNTIQRAYGELERRGYTYSVKGRGSFVGSIRKLRQARKEEMEGKLGVLAKEAKTIGMKKDEFVLAAGQAYDGGMGKIKGCEEKPIELSSEAVKAKPMDIPLEAVQDSGEALWVRNE